MNKQGKELISKGVIVAILALVVAVPVWGQEETGDRSEAAPKIETDDDTQSGYGDQKRESTFRFDTLQRSLEPYFDWKRRIKEAHGVSLGAQLYLLYQDASSNLDAFPFLTFSRGFLNRSFILNPTLPTTGFDWDTVQEGEWLKAVEVGYTPSSEQRNSKRVQLTYWEKDERTMRYQGEWEGSLVSANDASVVV